MEPIAPFFHCNMYRRCKSKSCPLDPEDAESSKCKCYLPMEQRIAIASRYPGKLRYGGLTKKEYTKKKSIGGEDNV